MLDAGALLRPYRIDRILHRGPVGCVAAATHVEVGERCALKILERADQVELVMRCRQEARKLALVQSPHVVGVFDFGVTETQLPYAVLEFLDGVDLARERPAADAIYSLARQACAGLAALHRLGIVHRDIKPGHLVVATGRLVIIDLRSAGTVPPGARIAPRGLVGTPAYMAPEQANGAAEPRSDLWSLGVVLYELLENTLPFAGSSAAELIANAASEPPRPMRSDRGLGDVVLRCLQKAPARRFANADELARALA